MNLGFSISTPNEVIREPADRTVGTAWIVWAGAAGLACGVVALIIAAPILHAAGHSGLAATIYQTFSFVCHQIPERSFHVAGHKFAVCSRCTGLYSGLAFAVLLYPVVKSLKRSDTPPIFWLFLAAMPLAIDFSLGYFNIWQNTHLSRFATGTLLGAVAVFYILPGLIELSSSIERYLGWKS